MYKVVWLSCLFLEVFCIFCFTIGLTENTQGHKVYQVVLPERTVATALTSTREHWDTSNTGLLGGYDLSTDNYLPTYPKTAFSS